MTFIKRVLAAPFLALMLMAAQGAAPHDAKDANVIKNDGPDMSLPHLSFEGLGDLRIGMTTEQLSAMGFGGRPQQDRQTPEEYFGCRYISNEEDYPGIALMLNEGKLVRIETMNNDWQTLSGVHVGMTIAQAQDIYGDWLKISRHPYGDDGIDNTAYLTLTSSDGKQAAIFETVHGKINHIRAGNAVAVSFIEGCS